MPKKSSPETPRRLTYSSMIELLVGALHRGIPTERSHVKLTRNARGDTQLEVSVRTGEDGIETVDQAVAKATSVYDQLRIDYPLGPGGELA